MILEAVMIVKNEEEMLGKCLDSLKGIDSIVICDTGSTDNTVEIAKKYTDKVYTDFTWNDSFCDARNHSLSKATGDWVLIIDADEELKSPISLIKKFLKGFDGDLVKIKTIGKDKKNENYSIRLFKRQPDIYWKGDIHNYLSRGTEEKAPFLLEYGYSPAHKKDPNRALRIAKKVCKENPEAKRERYYLAREYWYRKQWKKCVTEINKYLKVADFRAEIADAYLMKSRCLWNLQEGEKARVACMHAIMTNPDFKEALVLMAEMNFEPRKSKWLQYSEQANNEGVLFIRK